LPSGYPASPFAGALSLTPLPVEYFSWLTAILLGHCCTGTTGEMALSTEILGAGCAREGTFRVEVIHHHYSRLRTQVQVPEHVTGRQGRNQQIFRFTPARISAESRVG
jgi:hypothetical protein